MQSLIIVALDRKGIMQDFARPNERAGMKYQNSCIRLTTSIWRFSLSHVLYCSVDIRFCLRSDIPVSLSL